MNHKQQDHTGLGISRRQLGIWLGSASALTLTACGGGSNSGSDSSPGSGTSPGNGNGAGPGGETGGSGPAPIAAPVITHFPDHLEGSLDTAITISAQVTGDQPSYQWTRNGLDISGATATQYSFTPTLADDGALYAMRAWNSAGVVFSAEVELILRSDRSGTLLGLAGRVGGRGYLVGQGHDSRLDGGLYVMPDNSLYIARRVPNTWHDRSWGQLASDGQLRHFDAKNLKTFSGRPHLPVAAIGTNENDFSFHRWNNNAAGEYLIKSRHDLFYHHRLIDGDRDTEADVAVVRSPVLMDDGTLYFVDAINAAVRLLTPQNQVKTLAIFPEELRQSGYQMLVVLADGRLMMLVSQQGQEQEQEQLWRLERSAQGSDKWVWTLLPTRGLHGLLQTNSDGTKIYSAQGNALVQLTPDGDVTVLAGAVDASSSTRDGDARTARFSDLGPNTRLGVDGNFWFLEGSACLRRFNVATGQVRTVLGQSEQKGNADGQGSEARFDQDGIASWAADSKGNLYLAGYSTTSLRRVTPEGRVSTLLKNFPNGSALAIGPDGTFYGTYGHAVIRISSTGQQSVLAGQIDQSGYANGAGADALLYFPRYLAWDSEGHLLVAESARWEMIGREFTYQEGGSVRRVTLDGVVSSFIDRPSPGLAINPASHSLQLVQPCAMARNGLGQIAIADFWGGGHEQFRIYENNGRLLRVLTVPPFPHSDAHYAAYVHSSSPIIYLAWDGDEALLWAEGNLIRRIDMQEQTRIVAGTPGQWGVRRGALPGCLNDVAGLLGNPAKPKSYFVLSENSVLQMTL